MKTRNIVLSCILISSIILSSCSASKEEQIKNINELNEKVTNSVKTSFDSESAVKLLDAYQNYIDEFESDSITPEYHFKAAILSADMLKHKVAIPLLLSFIDKYPDNINTPMAIFRLANLYESQVFDLENARKYYDLFLQKFPNSELAELVKLSVLNMGKTPEQLYDEVVGADSSKVDSLN